MEGQRVIVIPNFSYPQYSVNGKPARYETRKDLAVDWLGIRIFLNGDVPNNEGYVSIVLLTFAKIDVSYLNCTVSVVDANGKSRYPQSFGIQGEYDRYSRLGEGRFVRRCVALDSDSELLIGDTMTLQFDFSWDIKMLDGQMVETINESISPISPSDRKQKRSRQLINGEDMFERKKCLKKLRFDYSSLSRRLQSKPKHYKHLFRDGLKENNLPLLSVEFDIHEYILSDLTKFFQQNNLDHVDSVDKCIALYNLSHKHGMHYLREISSERIKCLFTSANAVEVLNVAHLCKDAGLHEYVIVHFLLNWNEAKNSKEWTALQGLHPVLAKGVSRLANDIEVRNSGIEAGLRSLVLQCVFRKWREVQKYTRLTTTVQKLIVSCLRKDFYFNLLNLDELTNLNESGNSNEFAPVEVYKQHAKDYDFYR